MKKSAEEELQKLIFKKRKAYKKIGVIFCPILKSEVHFTGQGYRHLYIEGNGHPRGKKDAKMRLDLMEHAPNAVKYSKMIRKTNLTEAIDNNFGKPIIYHELFCKVDTRQAGVIVVVRQVGNGNRHFFGIRYARKRNKPR